MADARRLIPRTDVVLADPRLANAVKVLGPARLKAVVSVVQHRARVGDLSPEDVFDAVLADVAKLTSESVSSLRPVINATGVIVHTNLGRAPLSDVARSAVSAAAGATDIEFDLRSGARSRRGSGALAALMAAVPAAGAVHVVNNNAAALMLCAMALAPGKEIVLSRGELVEIGDSFRIPELLTSAGAVLREVGTTNRTKLHDYQSAVGPATGFVLKVHPSNYQVTGFTSSVDVSELVRLAAPVVVDIGSGLLLPHPLLPAEPDVSTVLKDGAQVVTASGDKLLGGPQAGLLFGAGDVIDRLRRHPIARALRVDKLTLAALEATVRGPLPPVLRALDTPPEEIRVRAERLAAALNESDVPTICVPCNSTTGGGSAPGIELPSWAVALPAGIATPLRGAAVPVVGRIAKDMCLLDLRTVEPSDDNRLLSSVKAAYDTCR